MGMKLPNKRFRVTVEWQGFPTDVYEVVTPQSAHSVQVEAHWWFVSKHGVPLFDKDGPDPVFRVEVANV